MLTAVAVKAISAYSPEMASLPDTQLFPFLADLSDRGKLRLTGSARLQNWADRTSLIVRGDEVAGAYLVEQGALRVYYSNAQGREGTLYWVEAGQTCIFALNCTFSRLPYPAWVESEGETRLTVIPGEVYRELFRDEPAVQQFTFAALSGRLFELMSLIEETASHGLESRTAAFLLRRSREDDQLQLTQEQLARHLSTSREVVSRVLRRLAARRLIACEPGRIHLLDRVQLASLLD